MTKSPHLLRPALLAAAALAFASAAAADEAPRAVPADPLAGYDEALIDPAELAELSGGDGVEIDVITQQTLSAINAGNEVNAETVNSGDVILSAQALQGFEGIGNFVINTGHNNNLQSSLNVSIVLAP